MNDSAQDSASTASSSSVAPPVLPHPVASVSLKLPPYWPNDPAVWFAQVEAQFLTRNLTSQATKYAYVVASLQPEIAQEVRDLLLNPPTTQPYDQLKSALIQRTSASEQKRLHQLLISEELGDRKPSQLLRCMHQLLGDNSLEDRILRQLFLQRLPTNVQLILASTSDTVSTDDLALLADKILAVAPPQPFIAAVHSDSPTTTTQIQDLRGQIDTLTTQLHTVINQLQAQPRSRSRGRSPTPSRSFPRRNSSATRPTGSSCWYHWRFGAAARKCDPPCSFTATSSNQQQENYQARD